MRIAKSLEQYKTIPRILEEFEKITKSLEWYQTIPKIPKKFEMILTNTRQSRLLQGNTNHFEIRLTSNYKRVSEFWIDSMINCCQIDRVKASINCLHYWPMMKVLSNFLSQCLTWHCLNKKFGIYIDKLAWDNDKIWNNYKVTQRDKIEVIRRIKKKILDIYLVTWGEISCW